MVQSERKRHNKNMLSSPEVSVRGLTTLVKEEKYGYFIWQVDKITLCHAVCQHEIGRKGVLLPIHHVSTLALATTKHSKTFQRLLSCGKK